MNRPMKPKGVSGSLYVLFDSMGEQADVFATREEAKGCAWGPRFRDGFTIVRYKRTTTKKYTEYNQEAAEEGL